MAIKVELEGRKFGRFTVLQEYKVRKDGRVCWFCECECGRIKLVAGKNLINGTIASCGCLRDEKTIARSYKHGANKRKDVNEIYVIWQGMKARCLNKNHISYSLYGAIGITVCDRWINSFENFYSDMGDRPSKIYSIERKEVDKGYTPENCYWATDAEQSKNKRASLLYEHDGGKYSLSELADLLGTNRANIYSFIRIKGRSVQEAFEFYKNKRKCHT